MSKKLLRPAFWLPIGKIYPAFLLLFRVTRITTAAAWRGVVHINPEGRLEPCPFSPYSDVSLKHFSLQEALQSPLLRTIRENH